MLRAADIYPLEVHDEVLSWAMKLLPSVPAEVELSARVGHSSVVGEQAVTVTGLAFAAVDAAVDPATLLEQLDSCPVVSRALRRSRTAVERLPDLHDRGSDGPTSRWDVDGIWTDTSGPEIIAAATTAGLKEIPSEHSFVLWMLWGHHPVRENACWSVQAPLYLSPNAGWEDATQDELHQRWVDESLRALSGYSRGVQFSDANLAARGGKGLSVENARRLEEIRGRYDPDGLFCSYMLPG
jgi:hypothetical protein